MPILSRVRDLALIALAVAGVVVCLELRLLVIEARADLASISRGTSDALLEWREYSGESLSLLRSPATQRSIVLLLRTGDDANRAVKRFNEVLTTLQTLIKETNVNLNSNLLPATTAAVRQTETLSAEAQMAIRSSRAAIETASEDLHTTSSQLAETLAGMQRTTDKAGAAIEQMRVVAADPAIAATMRHIEGVTANLETTSQRIATEKRGWFWRVFAP